MTETIRSYAAQIFMVVMPPAFAFWFVVHPFIGFWRRLGTRLSYAILFPALFAACYGLFLVRGSLVGIDMGTRWILVGVGVLFYGLAMVVERKCRRYLKLRTLLGVPEIAAGAEGPGELLDQGIYARVRHPRYLGVMLGATGIACVANYLGVWLLLLALVPVVYVLTLIEEKELRARFGEEYVRYARQVPRIIPRPG